MIDANYMVLLYDRERYAGEQPDPQYVKGDVRFCLGAFARHPGKLFHALIWTDSARTYEEARSLVPSGGTYFDRSRNWPSPMVPIEGWYFDHEPQRKEK